MNVGDDTGNVVETSRKVAPAQRGYFQSKNEGVCHFTLPQQLILISLKSFGASIISLGSPDLWLTWQLSYDVCSYFVCCG